MASTRDIEQDPCTAGECVGAVAADGRCFGHLGDDELVAALDRQRKEGFLDARGAPIDSTALPRFLHALREAHAQGTKLTARFDGATFSGDAKFDGATFSGETTFDGATFEGDAWFGEATFEGDAWFGEATFEGDAWFKRATFSGTGGFREATFSRDAWFLEAIFSGVASFREATFSRDTMFDDATFSGNAWFDGATFSRDAWFDGATFSRDAWFTEATFSRDAWVNGATFSGDAWFGEATFSGDAWFDGATFSGDARFNEATFEGTRTLGPMFVWKLAVFTGAVFFEQVTLWISAARVSLNEVAFRRGADLRIRWAQVELDDTDFGTPSLVASLPPSAAPGPERFLGWEEPIDGGWRCKLAHPPSGFEPHVIHLRRAKVGNLALSGVDLRACRFEGAHGLDQMRLESVRFAETPSGWHWKPIPWRWTRRQALAEEHRWRHPREGWYEDEIRVVGEETEPLPPARIAAIYRALRKGREDSKDEPGAADFYYGEMEMRRQKPQDTGGDTGEGPFSRSAGRAERLILWAYWLVSGYGLRASRALIALALTAVVFAFLFDLWGFDPDQGFGRALLFSIESTSSLFRVPELKGSLTAGGEVLQVVLRLLGPLFFALALLSVRGRVKR